jgi:hypothetical protein
MHPPAEEDLLQAWEEATAQHPLDRAITLLRAAWPQRSRGDLAGLAVGTRDSLLLLMREQLFGAEVRAVTECPGCGEELEVPATTSELRGASAPTGPPDGAPEALELDSGGITVRFRLLDSTDLAAVLACRDAGEGRSTLLARVVLEARQDGREITAAELPPDVVTALEEQLSRSDPQAEVLLNLVCPACETRWQTSFDAIAFLWTDVDRWARRLLGVVDVLARVYGWREADVLALSAPRRRIYVEMATS